MMMMPTGIMPLVRIASRYRQPHKSDYIGRMADAFLALTVHIEQTCSQVRRGK